MVGMLFDDHSSVDRMQHYKGPAGGPLAEDVVAALEGVHGTPAAGAGVVVRYAGMLLKVRALQKLTHR